jgi:hypothetical protein
MFLPTCLKVFFYLLLTMLALNIEDILILYYVGTICVCVTSFVEPNGSTAFYATI